MSLHRETSTMGCLYSTAINRASTFLCLRRFAPFVVRSPEAHQQTRTSTLSSTHSMTAKEEDANSLKPVLSKTVRRHQGRS